MFKSIHNFRDLNTSLLWLIVTPFLLTSCAMQGTWYAPQAPEGHAESGQCGISGRDDEWVLNRQGVKFYISQLTPVSAAPPGVAVVASVPTNGFVKISVRDIRTKMPNGHELKGEKSLVAIGRNDRHMLKEKLPIDTQILYGSKLASKRYPTTDYYFNLKLPNPLPAVFTVFLPRMKITGHEYPPLKIHFTKKTGTYFMTSINC